MDVITPRDTIWKMGGLGGLGVNIIGIGPHEPLLAEYQASKWLHMEEWRVLEENALTEDSAFSCEEIMVWGIKNRVTTTG